VESLIFKLRDRESQVCLLEKRIAELETENQRLWDAMRSTGEMLEELLHDDE
jgi:hypothetical protein